MKPKHLRIAGAIFALALAAQAWQYWQVTWKLGVTLAGVAVLAYCLMEWLARKEQEKAEALLLAEAERQSPAPPAPPRPAAPAPEKPQQQQGQMDIRFR